MFALCIDWFSPFRSQYTSWHSTGGIMMTILNLPQRLRYHPSMTYLAACTPGPKEPGAARLSGYLQPLLSELQEFADGKYIPTLRQPLGQLVRGDFCGLCTVTISTRIDHFSANTSDLHRDPEQHRSDSLRCTQPFRTIKECQTFERETGSRASPLNELPYWRSVERAPIDPMHNIELGLIKRLFHRTLIDGASVSKPQLQVIQTALASASVPPSEQAPDRRLGDPGGGSATAAHWSTLGRRMLVLLL
ncbi:unnamed protein product, partial [Tilletia laevis]